MLHSLSALFQPAPTIQSTTSLRQQVSAQVVRRSHRQGRKYLTGHRLNDSRRSSCHCISSVQPDEFNACARCLRLLLAIGARQPWRHQHCPTRESAGMRICGNIDDLNVVKAYISVISRRGQHRFAICERVHARFEFLDLVLILRKSNQHQSNRQSIIE